VPTLLRHSLAVPEPQARRMRCWISCSDMPGVLVPVVNGWRIRVAVDDQEPGIADGASVALARFS
jgi:hypothetical protein